MIGVFWCKSAGKRRNTLMRRVRGNLHLLGDFYHIKISPSCHSIDQMTPITSQTKPLDILGACQFSPLPERLTHYCNPIFRNVQHTQHLLVTLRRSRDSSAEVPKVSRGSAASMYLFIWKAFCVKWRPRPYVPKQKNGFPRTLAAHHANKYCVFQKFQCMMGTTASM